MKTKKEIRKSIFIIFEMWDNGQLTTIEYEEKIDNILTEWGRELCLEQQQIAFSFWVSDAIEIESVNKAPLPEILKDK